MWAEVRYAGCAYRRAPDSLDGDAIPGRAQAGHGRGFSGTP